MANKKPPLGGVISIHALREEGDGHQDQRHPPAADFYPRPPRGGRRQGLRRSLQICGISIHALREEGDLWRSGACPGRTISIHALREEGDGRNRAPGRMGGHFYPRPPRGGRRQKGGG